MDIYQWLHHTAQELKDPSQSDIVLGADRDCLQSHPRPKRRRPSGSSFLGPLVSKTRSSEDASSNVGKCPHKRREILHSLSSTSSFTCSTSSLSSSPVLSNHNQPPSPYKKRARYKTRSDKYKAYYKQPSRHARKRDGKRLRSDLCEKAGKGKNKREKARNKRLTGLVQTFQPKNVSKDRLTLDPAKTGLYTQGRASGPTRSRGCTSTQTPSMLVHSADALQVPDLVFSEMKFLQKQGRQESHRGIHPKHLSDTEKNHDHSERKREARRRIDSSKCRKNVEDEEISTYFGKGRVNAHQSDKETESRATDIGREHTGNRINEQSLELAVELLDKPFLGFGGRGNVPQSASYLTWSESEKPTGESQELLDGGRGRIVIGHLQHTIVDQPIGRILSDKLMPENEGPSCAKGPRIKEVELVSRKEHSVPASETQDHSSVAETPHAKAPTKQPSIGLLIKSSHGQSDSHESKTASQMHAIQIIAGDASVETSSDEIMFAHEDLNPEVQKRLLNRGLELHSSSPLAKLLKKCNATRCQDQEVEGQQELTCAPEQQISLQIASGQLRRAPAVSLPALDIYLHQYLDTSNAYQTTMFLEGIQPLCEGEALEVLRKEVKAEQEDYIDSDAGNAVGMDEYYRSDETNAFCDEANAQDAYDQSDHAPQYPCDELRYDDMGQHHVQRERIELSGFWRPNKLY